MRRSRALPEGLDFSQTLQPAFREARPLYGSAWTPSPHSSANPSPVSVNEGSDSSRPCFSAMQSPFVTNFQFTNPLGRSHSLSASVPAFPVPGRPFNENRMRGLVGQSIATTSHSNPILANNTYDCGSLPPIQYTRTPYQARDCLHFGRVQTTEGLSHCSGVTTNTHYISSPPSPSTLTYDHSKIVCPSDAGYRAASCYQTPNTNWWQDSRMSPPDSQYGQRSRPHQTPEQRRGSLSSQNSLPYDPSVHRHDQRSYSYGGGYYNSTTSSTDPPPRPTFLGAETAAGPDSRLLQDAAWLRVRSNTVPAYYNAQ